MVPSTTCSRPSLVERKVRPQKDQALNCPRCNSINTKFCYYNNYSLTQPRYFCKTCRRYWTEGGSLRNVPVGGGSRKNKRSSFSSPTSSKKTSENLNPPTTTSAPPTSQNHKIHEEQDLNLAFQTTQEYHNLSHDFFELPNIENSGATIGTANHEVTSSGTTASTTVSATSLSALELLRTGMASKKLSSFMPMPMSGHAPDSANSVYQSGFGLHVFKPSINFPFDGMENGGRYENVHGVQDHSNGRLLFPFEDLKPVIDFDQDRGQADSSRYWNGMLGGSSW